MNYAGEFLQEYERKRYSWFERGAWILPAINLPEGAVELPDFSFWQYPVDFTKLATHTRAVILRLGQGAVLDRNFEEYYRLAREKGLYIGAYHFYDGRVAVGVQADFIARTLESKPLDMELTIDWERAFGGGHEGLNNVVSLMRTVENRVSAEDVDMYTGYYWFVENTDPLRHAAEFAYLKTKPLHLAWYAAPSVVRIPRPWTTWTKWQYGTPVIGKEWGMSSFELDMNRFNGNMAAFITRYGAIDSPTLPPDEPAGVPNMNGIYSMKTVSQDTRLRPTPNTEQPYIGLIPAGVTLPSVDIFIAPVDRGTQKRGDIWLQTNYGGVLGWVAYIHAGYFICNEFKILALPTLDKPVITIATQDTEDYPAGELTINPK